MSDRTFTLEEANLLLPVLESLLKRAMESKQTIESCDKELQELSHRIFLTGGLLVDVMHVVRRRAERERSVQAIKDSIQEIHATGVQVKDLDLGLLDFPCVVRGETVLLCWKLGEGSSVQHWHGLSEGYAGRKPISTLDLDPRKGKRPGRPN
jgi:hypothetical protein